ncbi:MAG: 4-(cytidine 5'-diphospho)-2-C-methyl-D-erythritol kinase [Clostridia bacterium]|nr:4-(cytidine 5'-diphospho)-2-C-methyl-D-erythritol kinase [Clostridia bacterium]
MRIQKERANAKINLYLDVVSTREDGFHDIKSIMHAVSLCDEISVKYIPSKTTYIRLFVEGNRFLPTDSKNLAYRAAALFLEKASLTAGIEITMHKNIPVAAGLAGGSADAAAVLKALNKIFGKLFSDKALSLIGAELGSDIPFCLYGKTALCEGRGEIVTKLPDSLKMHFVIALGNEHVSTPTAYKRLDEIYSNFDGSVKTGGENRYSKLLDDMKNGILTQDALFNVFEPAVLQICPNAEKIKSQLSELGALATLMSGSGPSVFGVFSSKESALSAIKELHLCNVNAYYAYSIT